MKIKDMKKECKKEYILKFCDPQIVIQEGAKEDFKKLMDLDEKSFMKLVFMRFSK